MPRPKKNKAQTSFSVWPRTPSSDAQVKLLALLECADADSSTAHEAIAAVERAAGFAIDASPHIDDMPRPADYINEFKTARKAAWDLSEKLCGWSGFFSEPVKMSGCDPEVLIIALVSFVDATGKAMKQHENKSSKGARKNAALRESIKQLRTTFRKHYLGSQSGRAVKGAFQSMSAEELAELDFVLIALKDSRAIPKNATREKMRRHFLHADCAVPGERQHVMRRIAARVANTRIQ